MGVSWGMYVRRGGLSEWSSGGVVVVVSQINGDDGVYGCGVWGRDEVCSRAVEREEGEEEARVPLPAPLCWFTCGREGV